MFTAVSQCHKSAWVLYLNPRFLSFAFMFVAA
uniref:Uncharacterized protein n=1 Tax=Arundo donax TaxID=35708 RepID=A0A0A8Y5G4_ARUDO